MAVPSSPDIPEAPSLADLTAEPGYLFRVGEVIQQIPAAINPADAVDLLERATHLMGAEVAAFVSFIRDDASHESYRFLLACDPTWCFKYEQLSWFAADPWLAYALTHSEPICGSEIAAPSNQQRAVVQLAEEFGFRSTVIVPAPSSGGLSRLGLLCLGSATAGYFEAGGLMALRIVARSLAMELHEWWVAQIKRELIMDARITDEDLALLEHERQGHSTKAIASVLDSTPSAIDTRFQRVNAKLGVPNRKAAARLAAEYGLI